MPENTQEVNVRVAVRVRPLLPKEKLAGEQTCVRIIPTNNQVVLGKDRSFTFDNVLSSRTSQEEVYKVCVDQLVTKFFQGYNATVFAYGQTGSGKTFTVGSGNITVQTESDFGVVPRAVKKMFEHMEANPQRDYLIKVSYTELYKEELVDLLDLETSSKDLHIREDDKGNTLIMGISEVTCQTLDDVMECLQRGSTYRHTGSTQMNEHSSRSHTVFSITIEQTWTDDDADDRMSVSSKKIRKTTEYDPEIMDDGEVHHYMCAKFHFVDLAGSERARRTGNIGDRFKESVHINSGLLALGNVISALGDPKKKVHHIPYRDSKITRILKDSLGGNANTLMICCVSPCVSSFDETLNVVKFANRARNIMNKPVVNRDQQSIRFEEMQSEIKALREELNRQRTSVVPGSLDPDIARAIGEVGQMKEMEDKISRIETECSHYRMIADEAYKQFVAIQDKNVLTNSMDGRLKDWLELMEEIKNKVPSTLSAEAWKNQTILQLEDQIKQAQHDLKSDEEIFSEKAKEMTSLKDRIGELENANNELQDQLQESNETLKQQEEQLVSQQVLIEQLQTQLKERDKDLDDMESIGEPTDLLGESGPLTTNRRAKSVPVQMLGNRSARSDLGAPATRNIHTSPALFSLERVMAGFRARSQLLASRLDESDEVLQQHFSDLSDEDEVIQQQSSKNSDGQKKGKRDRSPFQRNTSSRGTYRVSKPRFNAPRGSQDSGSGEPKLPHILQTDDAKWMIKKSQENLNFSKASKGIIDSGTKVLNLEGHHEEITASQRQRLLKESEIGVRQSTQKIRDLSINIRMKEQLIKELIKSGKEAQNVNKQYEGRIKSLEKERQEIKQDLSALQKAVQDAESKDKTEKDKIQGEFRKKMEAAKLRLQNLSKKQRETEKMASLTGANERRVNDLERAVDKMRQEQENLQKKLKDESEKKQRLQREMQKEQQRVRELETKNEQQKKILRVKTEEAAAANRRLRSVSGLNEEQNKLEEQRKWLDAEMEKVLDQRKQVEDLEKDLQKREDLVVKKEAMLAEKSELQMKKMRSSQVLSKEFQTVSNSLMSLDRKIQEKSEEVALSPRDQQSKIMDELKALTSGKDRLAKQRHALDEKIQDGAVLSTQEERRLIELDEALEALDAAIEFKTEAIQNKQQELRKSSILTKSEDNLLSRLNTLSVAETRSLLTKYFEKVIDLREDERKKVTECSELQMQIEELEKQIQEMESSLERAAMEKDRRLTQQQQDYEKKMQLLMHQLSEAESQQLQQSGRKDSTERDAKTAQLEKDLYYYKKTSRELKKKLRELLGSYSSTTPDLNREKLRDDIMESLGKSPMTNREGSSSTRPPTQSGSSSHRSENGNDQRLSSRAAGSPRTKPPEGECATPVRISRKELRRMSAEEVSLRMSVYSDAGPADSLDASQLKSSNA